MIGLLAMPWQSRDRAQRPVVLVSLVTFLITSLVFPVATTWGTFLHAAGAIHVLLVIAALLLLGEPLTLPLILSAAAILIGVFIAQRR